MAREASGLDATTASDPADRLDSWKDIATYLKRDATTVQRWERRERLPIHRQQPDKLGSATRFDTRSTRGGLIFYWNLSTGRPLGTCCGRSMGEGVIEISR